MKTVSDVKVSRVFFAQEQFTPKVHKKDIVTGFGATE